MEAREWKDAPQEADIRRGTPKGTKIGWVDEYGTVWNGEPGNRGSDVIGDLVATNNPEVFALYIEQV